MAWAEWCRTLQERFTLRNRITLGRQIILRSQASPNKEPILRNRLTQAHQTSLRNQRTRCNSKLGCTSPWLLVLIQGGPIVHRSHPCNRMPRSQDWNMIVQQCAVVLRSWHKQLSWRRLSESTSKFQASDKAYPALHNYKRGSTCSRNSVTNASRNLDSHEMPALQFGGSFLSRRTN